MKAELQILKFRHFARYYFELDYDWDKLLFLLKKFHDLRGWVREDLGVFGEYLRALAEQGEYESLNDREKR